MENEEIERGKLTVIGNGVYGICEVCGKLVQGNKFLLGSLHRCRSKEEIARYGKWGELND